MVRINSRHKKRLIVAAAAAAVLLAAFLGLGALSYITASKMESQEAAQRWSGGGDIKYAQISCFISSDASFTQNRAKQMAPTIDDKLKQASIKSEGGGASNLWIYAYSTETKLGASTDYGSITASVTAVGGSFFVIHPMDYISGYAFSSDDLMQDRVVLDEDAAWQLFGSFDIQGQPLNISGKSCVVAGVVKKKNDGVSDALFKLAYGDKPRIYISYDLLDSIKENSPLSCYEAVLPSPITGFAKDIVKGALGTDEAEVVTVENSSRYNFLELLDTIKGLDTRAMKTNRVIYPFWENIAAVVGDRLAVILLIRVVLASVLLLGAFIFAVRFIITHPINKEKFVDFKDSLEIKISRGFRERKRRRAENKVRRRLKTNIKNTQNKL